MAFNNFAKNLVDNKIVIIISVFFLTIIILSANNVFDKLSEPYNQYSYLYSIRNTKEKTISVYINERLIKRDYEIKDGTSDFLPLFDGSGFYKIISPSLGATISCGGEELVGSSAKNSKNSICVIYNDNEYPADGHQWPFYADKSIIIYEQCENVKFYQSMAGNGCSKINLKFNNMIIDSQEEGYGVNYLTKERELQRAPNFENIKVEGSKIFYHKWDFQNQTSFLMVYDLKTRQRSSYPGDGRGIIRGEIIDNSLAFLFWNDTKSTKKNFYYQDQVVPNVESFAYLNNNFYFIERQDDYLALKNENGLLNKYFLNNAEKASIFSYNIGIYPNCGEDSGFCLYNSDSYASIFCNQYREAGNYGFCINSGNLINPAGTKNLNELFVFSYNNDSYAIYADFVKGGESSVIGKNLDTGDETTLFDHQKLKNKGYIENLRVFKK